MGSSGEDYLLRTPPPYKRTDLGAGEGTLGDDKNMENIWLTAVEVSRYLKVKPRTVLAWAKQGRIPGHALSGSKRVTWRFLKSELDDMLTLPSAVGFGGPI
jgi:excisionase family DNA binding protein